ncbi:MAG: cell division protein FtsQ/DivIB [Pyrinomonadaceae bacterium]
MREQMLTQKVGNRSGISKGRSGVVTQRPVKRDRGSAESVAAGFRMLLRYVPMIFKAALVITITALVFFGYRAAASANFFQVKKIETQGTSRASMEAIETAVRHDLVGTGVWRAHLEEVSAHLRELPWVRSAIVSRVLPDGIRVRIVERQPRLVVHLSSGRLVWVDEEGVVLAELVPADTVPSFFLRGWNEDQSTAAQEENRERVKKFLDLQNEWMRLSLSERISEVNLLDIRDVRAQLSGDDSQIEVRLGAQDHGERLRKALDVLDKQRQTPRGPYISYIDLTQGHRAIVGLISGARAVSDTSDLSPAVAEKEGSSIPTKNEKAKDKNAKPPAQPKKSEQKRT